MDIAGMQDMATWGQIAVLLTAAFVAGALNAIAGGGSFLTLPALVWVGVPPVVANATGTFALLPGYAASAWGFKSDMAPPPGLSMARCMTLALIGGAVGATLLLVTPDAVFRKVVPWLLLAATALFALGPQLRSWAAGHNNGNSQPFSTTKATLGMLAVAFYGGYFNGGLGILCLALFSLLGQTQLNAMNGMKNLVSALLTAIAVGIYAAGGIIQWQFALPMAAAAVLGGYGGARVARHLPPHVLRWMIVLTGLVMSALFFSKT